MGAVSQRVQRFVEAIKKAESDIKDYEKDERERLAHIGIIAAGALIEQEFYRSRRH